MGDDASEVGCCCCCCEAAAVLLSTLLFHSTEAMVSAD